MKNPSFCILLLFSIVSLFSCIKKEDCPEGYTGDLCNEEKRPRSILLERIDLLGVNGFDDETLQPWDLNYEEPDLYIVILQNGQEVFSTKNRVLNNAKNAQTISLGYSTKNVSLPTTIRLMDADEGDSDDIMAERVISLYESGQAFPAKIKQRCENCSHMWYEFDLYVSYTF